jgi:quinol monooxygenase YgiN
MFVVCARLLARAGQESVVEEAMRQVVPASRAEPGCLMYVAHRDVADPRRFMFYEQYVDEAAYDAHRETEHFRRWVTETIAPALEERERAIYTEVA